jgi:pyruvate/2-oxoglutarate/acetoin dehydrogenase E1 component
MAADNRVILIGEDILDPYGGAFKVTRGLSTAYPERVITTPISEAGFTGLAIGMAMRGLRPVVEIMFGDFLTLCADQIINHAAKFRWIYNDQVSVPLIIRTPMGGRRGYGPTHSQTLEKLFLGIPGVQVIAPCQIGDPGSLLASTILATNDPVLFVENKLLYLLGINQGFEEFDLAAGHFPQPHTLCLSQSPAPCLTIATYGYMTELVRQAALHLAYQEEIFSELVIYEQLAPFEISGLLQSLRQTRKLLLVEEGTLTLGWGAEMAARAAENLGQGLKMVQRVAAQETPIPSSGFLEEASLPGVQAIVEAARKMAWESV